MFLHRGGILPAKACLFLLSYIYYVRNYPSSVILFLFCCNNHYGKQSMCRVPYLGHTAQTVDGGRHCDGHLCRGSRHTAQMVKVARFRLLCRVLWSWHTTQWNLCRLSRGGTWHKRLCLCRTHSTVAQ